MDQEYINFINELKIGDVITTDIYFNKTLLIKAGTVVNEKLLQNLQHWGITNLYTLQPYNHLPSEINREVRTIVKKKEKIFYSKELFDIKELFYESLQYVVSETRYGLIMNSDLQLQWLENLFISTLLDTRISTSLFSLKKHDPYSYFHSFDVFLLGSLLAKRAGITDIRSFATGCLIHDIGKLKISRGLLQKSGTLSKSEFEKVQKHPLYGVDFLNENNLPLTYLNLIKSHHERLDGTGYPEGLTEESLSEEVKLLAVVDTYSALTLHRPYRKPFSSTKAIELLLGKEQKYDIKYVIRLMELINIYPTDCIVQLSNGNMARVKTVNENQPYLPIIEEMNTKQTYELPLNFSVTIIRFIKWDQISQLSSDQSVNTKAIYWNHYFNELINGNMAEAVRYYKLITDGMTANNIFIDVVIRSIKEIEAKRTEGQLSIGEEHDALLKIKDILALTVQ